MKKTTTSNSAYIAGRRPAHYGQYYCGPFDFEDGPDMACPPTPVGGDVRANARARQRLAPMNHAVSQKG